MSKSRLQFLKRREPLRLGFLPASDSAPVVFAYETGLFAEYGLDIQLQRETSLSSLREKVTEGELDAAHAPAMLPFVANIGVESDPCACVSGLVLSLQGNRITVSRAMWDGGVRDASTLRDYVYKHWKKRTPTFAVVAPLSTSCLLLRRWLSAAGIQPDTQIRILLVPPEQMYPTLKLGYIDGFCAGEPWSELAANSGYGVTLATGADLAPLQPEKLLMVRQSFATGRAKEHELMAAALIEACAQCADPANREFVSDMLAHPCYVNAPAECILARFPGSMIYSGGNANEPSEEKAAWLMHGLYELLASNPLTRPDQRSPVLVNVFRRDIYARALAAQASGFARLTVPERLGAPPHSHNSGSPRDFSDPRGAGAGDSWDWSPWPRHD